VIDPRSYLGLKLKDDLVLELLAKHDLNIRYDIDVLHENIPDAYWVEDAAHGFTLKADATQLISCGFVYLRPRDGHQAFTGQMPGIDIVGGVIPTLGQPSKSGSSGDTSWVRYDRADLSIHLTIDLHGPSMICLMLPSQVP